MSLTAITLVNDEGEQIVGESMETLETSAGDPIYLFRRLVVTRQRPNANLTLTASAPGTVLVGVHQVSSDDGEAEEDGPDIGESWPTTMRPVSANEVGQPITSYGIFCFPFDLDVDECWFDMRITLS